METALPSAAISVDMYFCISSPNAVRFLPAASPNFERSVSVSVIKSALLRVFTFPFSTVRTMPSFGLKPSPNRCVLPCSRLCVRCSVRASPCVITMVLPLSSVILVSLPNIPSLTPFFLAVSLYLSAYFVISLALSPSLL